MEEVFLLKYAVFALSFINKLDSKLDQQFYLSFSLEFQQDNNWSYYVYLLEAIHNKGQEEWLEMAIPPEQFNQNNVYDLFLDSLFDAYLADNGSLVKETISFYLLPMERGIDLIQVSAGIGGLPHTASTSRSCSSS